jgi:hypothetical protein
MAKPLMSDALWKLTEPLPPKRPLRRNGGRQPVRWQRSPEKASVRSRTTRGR